MRQGYLDALPIAAAMLTVDEGGTFIECANDNFRLIAEWDERMGDRLVAHVPLLRSGPIGTRLSAFLKSDDPAYQFDTTDGRSLGGRHFTVRFARLQKLPGHPSRCLVSLIDKTAQVETEKSLRSEMLRDTLTGLPNRFAFNEQVDAVLADPQFREGSYAVLAIDMTRFSRVNECMGSLAGDELLITFARRLVSALRPTDMLARISAVNVLAAEGDPGVVEIGHAPRQRAPTCRLPATQGPGGCPVPNAGTSDPPLASRPVGRHDAPSRQLRYHRPRPAPP